VLTAFHVLAGGVLTACHVLAGGVSLLLAMS